MKIFNNLSQNFTNNKKKNQAEIFKRNNKVGDVVKGRVDKIYSDKYAYVIINNQKLLAEISSTPQKDQILTFLIIQLQPKIILKELNSSEFDQYQNINSINKLIKSFIAARANYEAITYPHVKNITSEDYFKVLENLPNGSEALTKTLAIAHELNILSNNGSLLYMPWLIPSAINHELIVKKNPKTSFYTILFSFEQPPNEPTKLQIFHKSPDTAIKVFNQTGKMDSNLLAKLKSNKDFRGVEVFTPELSTSLLFELLK